MIDDRTVTVVEPSTRKERIFDSSVLEAHNSLHRFDYGDKNNVRCELREGIPLMEFERLYNLLSQARRESAIFQHRGYILDYMFAGYFEKHETLLRLYDYLYLRYGKTITPKLYHDFANLEQCLFAFERGKYRDHFLHMFNVYLMGELVLGRIVRFLLKNGPDLQSVFKVTSEHEDLVAAREEAHWGTAKISPEERIYPIWFYMSTFHDVGYPVQESRVVRRIAETYRTTFLFDIQLNSRGCSQSVSELWKEYLRRVLALYDWRLRLRDDGDYDTSHDLTTTPALLFEYIQDMLSGEPIDHGVASALLLIHYVRQDAVQHYGKKWREYVDHYVNQDLSRAALGICIHSLDPDKMQIASTKVPLFPIRFDEFPLTFLLILFDELEEWGRPEFTGYFFPRIYPVRWDIEVEESERLGITIIIDFRDVSRWLGQYVKVKRSDSLKSWVDSLVQMIVGRIRLGETEWMEVRVCFKLPAKEAVQKYISEMPTERVDRLLGDTDEALALRIIGTDRQEIEFKIQK